MVYRILFYYVVKTFSNIYNKICFIYVTAMFCVHFIYFVTVCVYCGSLPPCERVLKNYINHTFVQCLWWSVYKGNSSISVGTVPWSCIVQLEPEIYTTNTTTTKSNKSQEVLSATVELLDVLLFHVEIDLSVNTVGYEMYVAAP